MYDSDDDEDFVSKSELKREMQRYQDLGETLCNLPPNRWPGLPVSDTLRNALEESRRIGKHEARRRHFQYVGKLMRDENIDAIQEAVDLLDPSSEAYGRRTKQYEQWRTRLIDKPQALSEFLDEFPETDRQQLRNLVRNAQKEMSQQPPKPGTSYKKLYQLIKDSMA
ncbi:MAG: hypothetical protein CMI00_14895 [Oceanospirillaceae bacterium]|nr:hypothetical protein [Oceanospirillaceae bacterium]|tara:strand:- start:54399 stop:54899 length:501 start_codon:yes stop_codon:yes gene_type:complete